MRPEKREHAHQSSLRNHENPIRQQQCLICLDEKAMSNFITLTCTHSFCTECLTHIIDTSIYERSTAQLRCPLPECARLLNEADIKIITNNNQAKIGAIADIQTQEWIAKQPNAKHCPTVNCPYVFLNDNPQAQTIRCPQCNQRYCSNCLFLHDQKISCRAAESERKTNPENQQWLQAHTKPCPQCGTRIEKNGGCDYVTCRNCRHGFCLNCYGTHHVSKCTLPAVNIPLQVNQQGTAQLQREEQQEQERARREDVVRQQHEAQLARQQEALLARQRAQQEAAAREQAERKAREEAQHIAELEQKRRAQEMLYRAILNDSAENIMQATDAGADVNLEINNKSPLMIATLLRKITAFEALLNAGANANIEAKKLVEITVKLGNFRPVRILLERGVIEPQFYLLDPQKPGHGIGLITPAIMIGDVRSAIYLLDRGIGFSGRGFDNRWNKTIIDEIFCLLNRQVANADIPIELILELIQKIINHGYITDNIWYWGLNGHETWILANRNLIYQRTEILELFLRNGANPNHVIDINMPHRSSGGIWTWTPLLRAIKAGERVAVQVLLNAGADINLKANPISSQGSFTPLAFAVECGNAEIVELLVERGAELFAEVLQKPKARTRTLGGIGGPRRPAAH